MKQTHRIHVCLIIFLIHYFDMIKPHLSIHSEWDSLLNQNGMNLV